MADITSVDLARLAGENLEQASPDLLRAMVKTFAEALMGAEADAICGAPYGQPSEERVNYRNGYRDRRWDTRRARSSWRSQAAPGQLFPGVAAGAAPPLRAGADLGCGDVLPAGRVDPAGGEAGRDAGHQEPVQVPGQ